MDMTKCATVPGLYSSPAAALLHDGLCANQTDNKEKSILITVITVQSSCAPAAALLHDGLCANQSDNK
eukprot:1160598-Pelagomonas_calceolata.AAC.2